MYTFYFSLKQNAANHYNQLIGLELLLLHVPIEPKLH